MGLKPRQLMGHGNINWKTIVKHCRPELKNLLIYNIDIIPKITCSRFCKFFNTSLPLSPENQKHVVNIQINLFYYRYDILI